MRCRGEWRVGGRVVLAVGESVLEEHVRFEHIVVRLDDDIFFTDFFEEVLALDWLLAFGTGFECTCETTGATHSTFVFGWFYGTFALGNEALEMDGSVGDWCSPFACGSLNRPCGASSHVLCRHHRHHHRCRLRGRGH